MSFLHLYLLAGLVLVGVPILVHLVTREKPRHFRFPAFRFLVQNLHTTHRKLRLHQILLMILRMLLIALLCLALARPRLFTERIPWLGGSQRAAVVLLFDVSPSMDYRSGELSRLDDAKRRALELLNELGPGSRVAILDTSGAVSAWLENMVEARERINALTIQPASDPVTRQLSPAYRLLKELEADTEGTPPPRFLFLFSDRTRACWDSAEGRSLQGQQPAGVGVVFVDVGKDSPADVAIDDVRVEPSAVPPGGRFRIRVTVRGTGGKHRGQVRCAFLKDTASESRAFQVEDGVPAVLDFEYRSGSGGKLGEGFHQLEVKLAGKDPLPFNDVRFATFAVRRGRGILTIADDPQGEAVQRLWSLWLEIRGFRSTVASPDEAGQLSVEELRKNDVVVLFHLSRPSPVLWAKLERFVRDGGGLAVFPGVADEQRGAYNDRAAQNVLPGRLEKLVTLRTEALAWNWSAASRKHVLIAPFLRWMAEEQPDFLEPGRVPRARKFWETQKLPDGEVVLPYQTHEGKVWPAVLERLLGQGKVLLFTTVMDSREEKEPDEPSARRWNNYWESSFGPALADRLCLYLAGETLLPQWNYLSGPPVVFTPPAGDLPQTTYTLFGPGLPREGLTLQLPAGVPDNPASRHISISRAVQPGNYQVKGERNREVEAFSVNIPRAENDLERLPKELIEGLLGPGSVVPVSHDLNLRDALQNRPQPLDLLPWLMILLLVVLAVENLVANRNRELLPAVTPAAAPTTLQVLFRVGLGLVAGFLLGLLLGGVRSSGLTGTLALGVVLASFGAAHAVLSVARFPPRDGAILGGILGSMAGVLWGWLVLTGLDWLDGTLAVVLGMLVGAAVLAVDGWLTGYWNAKRSGILS